MPGVLLFRMASGLVQLDSTDSTTFEMVRSIIADGLTATNIILAMTVALVVSKVTQRIGSS